MRDNEPVDTLWVTRAEYEAKFGRKPSKEAIGVMIYAADGSPMCQVLFATPEDEVATLEDLYSK